MLVRTYLRVAVSTLRTASIFHKCATKRLAIEGARRPIQISSPPKPYGLGGGVACGRGVGADLGVGVTLGVELGVDVGVAVAVGLALGVAVGVGEAGIGALIQCITSVFT